MQQEKILKFIKKSATKLKAGRYSREETLCRSLGDRRILKAHVLKEPTSDVSITWAHITGLNLDSGITTTTNDYKCDDDLCTASDGSRILLHSNTKFVVEGDHLCSFWEFNPEFPPKTDDTN